jgi:signal transduction histidine kinase
MSSTTTSTAAPRVRVDVRRAGTATAIAALYAASGEVGFVLVVPVAYSAAVAPLSASALAMCLLWGFGCWPVVFAASLLLGLWSGLNHAAFSYELLLVSSGVAGAATLHALSGAWLVRALAGLRQPLAAAFAEQRHGARHDRTLERDDDDDDKARELAVQGNRAETSFLGNMSHEMLTPMHAVLSYAQLGRDAPSAGEQRDYFERIAERGQSLLKLLSNLLDLSRLESGSMSMEFAPHDIAALLRDALLQMEPALRAKGLQSDFQRAPDCDDGRVIVDPVRIGQLLGNILTNAVRFSPEGGRIGVQLSRTTLQRSSRRGLESNCAALEIAISDQGVGIPASELELIFDKFVESSKTRSNAGGIGLGLAICREIVTLHRGAIYASNNSGSGATVRVVLPLARGALAERGTA